MSSMEATETRRTESPQSWAFSIHEVPYRTTLPFYLPTCAQSSIFIIEGPTSAIVKKQKNHPFHYNFT